MINLVLEPRLAARPRAPIPASLNLEDFPHGTDVIPVQHKLNKSLIRDGMFSLFARHTSQHGTRSSFPSISLQEKTEEKTKNMELHTLASGKFL